MQGEPGDRRLLLGVVASNGCERIFAKLFDEERVPVALRPAGDLAPTTGTTHTSWTSRAAGHDRLRAGRVHDRHVRRKLQLAGSAVVPAQLPGGRALERYDRFFGDSFRIEYPTGSGEKLTLGEIAQDLRRRLISIFLVGPDGRRPCFGCDRAASAGPPLEGQPAVQRVLPRRQRGRAGGVPSDRVDRDGGRRHPPQARCRGLRR